MCDLLRNTFSLGRAVVPKTRWRTRIRRRSSLSALRLMIMAVSCRLLAGLAFLLPELFALIANALLLVDVGRLDRTKVRRGLPDHPLVDAFHRDDRLLVHFGFDALGQRELDGMGVADVEAELLSLHRGLVPDAGDFQRPLVALGHTEDHVLQLGARQSVQRLRVRLLIRPVHLEVSIHRRDGNRRIQLPFKPAERPFDGDGAVGHLDLDARRNRNNLSTDARHRYNSTLTRCGRALRRRDSRGAIPGWSSRPSTWTESRRPCRP